MKFFKFLYYSFFLPILFFLIIFNLLSKKKIKICRLRVDRIGHLTGNTESIYFYIKENKFNHIYIFTYDGYVCNRYLLYLIKKKINVIKFFYPISLLAQYLKIKSIDDINEFYDNKSHWKYINKYPKPFIEIPNKDIAEGENYLKKFNLGSNSKFVCLYVRDSAYLTKVINSEEDWTYHNSRDADIKTYIKSVEYLIDKGYNVFRIGSHVLEKLVINDTKFFDYSCSNDRTDFLDLFLIFKCEFMILAGGGLAQVAEIFRKPVLDTNVMPISDTRSLHKNLFLTKKIYDLNKNKLLSYSEINNRKLSHIQDVSFFNDNNLKVIDNSEDEIYLATVEFLNIIKNNCLYDVNDLCLLDKYLKINPYQKGASSISIEFLKRNLGLLNFD